MVITIILTKAVLKFLSTKLKFIFVVGLLTKDKVPSHMFLCLDCFDIV